MAVTKLNLHGVNWLLKYTFLFLSAAEGQRPRNYLSCCSCYSSWIFHLMYALSTSITLLPLHFSLSLRHTSLFLTPPSPSLSTHLCLSTNVYLPVSTYLHQHTYLSISTHLPIYFNTPTYLYQHTYQCMSTYHHLPTYFFQSLNISI